MCVRHLLAPVHERLPAPSELELLLLAAVGKRLELDHAFGWEWLELDHVLGGKWLERGHGSQHHGLARAPLGHPPAPSRALVLSYGLTGAMWQLLAPSPALVQSHGLTGAMWQPPVPSPALVQSYGLTGAMVLLLVLVLVIESGVACARPGVCAWYHQGYDPNTLETSWALVAVELLQA
eukprot:4508768-Amphidinium_carterae.1